MDNFLFAGDYKAVTTADEIEALQKALLAPESTDDLYNTSGGVITQQSLEGMLASLTLNENDFTYWKDVNKSRAFSTVEEYVRQVGLGQSDGGFVGQLENPEFNDPDFDKPIAIVKFLSEGWQAGDVAMATKTIVGERAEAQTSAMLRLLRNLDMKFYNGNSAMVPEEFDGLEKTIAGQSNDNVRDLRGTDISQSAFNLVAQLIEENNGNPNNAKIYSSPAGRSNIHDIISGTRAGTIQNFYSNSGDANLTIGGEINFVQTPFGRLICRTDKLLGLSYESRSVPVVYNKGTGAFDESATSSRAPSTPTVVSTAVSATVTGSLFAASTVRPSGTVLRYRVVARNKWGRSAASTIAVTGAVDAAGAVDVVITPNPADVGAKLPTCFEILAEKAYLDGKFRLLTTVAAASPALGAVTYRDLNTYIPGTARMFVVDQTTTGRQRVTGFAQLLPIHNTDLSKTGRFVQGLINLYGVPKYYKPNVLVEIRNISVDQNAINYFNTI